MEICLIDTHATSSYWKLIEMKVKISSDKIVILKLTKHGYWINKEQSNNFKRVAKIIRSSFKPGV